MEKLLKNYDRPTDQQVGYLVEVRVGHIDQFKFYEEFQVDYHLRRAGFLKQLEIFNKQQRSLSIASQGSLVPQPSTQNAVLKTEQEKLIAK